MEYAHLIPLFIWGEKTEKTLVGGPAMFRKHARIRIIGSKHDVEQAEITLKAIPDLENIPEAKVRLIIQELIENKSLKATIIFDGTSIWNRRKILANLSRIIQAGKLYNEKKPRFIPIGSMLRIPTVGDCILSDYFYNFLRLHCGSIAHYSKSGWVAIYPMLDDLKAFFKKNEHGHRVIDDVPGWATDIRRIVEDIEKLLFPLQSYIAMQQKT